jgi:hypothetical protein
MRMAEVVSASWVQASTKVQHPPLLWGTVEKVRQRRSRLFVVLTYFVYAPRAKEPAALLDGPF